MIYFLSSSMKATLLFLACGLVLAVAMTSAKHALPHRALRSNGLLSGIIPLEDQAAFIEKLEEKMALLSEEEKAALREQLADRLKRSAVKKRGMPWAL